MQNRYTPTDYERDNADDDLNRIIRHKEDLTDWLDSLQTIIKGAPKNFFAANHDEFAVYAATAEEGFDDLMHHEWHRLKEISQSIEWTAQIPTCEVLRATMAQKRRDAAAQRLHNNHTPPINPSTLETMGVNGFGNDVTGSAV